MSNYKLITNAKAVGALPPNPSVQPVGSNNPNLPPISQQFHLVLSGIGACSATIQHYGSNDDANWQPYMDPITVSGTLTGGTSRAQASATGSSPWHRIGAIVTAISGTSAAVSDTMVAGG